LAYFFMTLVGMIGGGICVYVALLNRAKSLDEQKEQQLSEAQRINDSVNSLRESQHDLEERWNRLKSEAEELKSRIVSYKELQDENSILRRDLRNLDVHLRKLSLDDQIRQENQGVLDERCKELGARYLKDHVKWIGSSLNPNNFALCKERLQDVIERCRGIGFEISKAEEASYFADLKQEFTLVVRAAFEREEQSRIRTQIREEQQREREVQRELQRLQREREAIQTALAKALAEAHDQHSEEVDRLQAKLAEAEARSQRAVSQAQLTKAGHVYVISNVGSFGEGIFKVGMTRRLEPMDRVSELGDASVPFPFDIHMMISSNDAPTLENALHRKLHKTRLNKVNPRREFFRTDVQAIYEVVRQHHGEVEYVADAEALQYRQSLSMSDDDQEFIEDLYNQLDEGEEDVIVEAGAPTSEFPATSDDKSDSENKFDTAAADTDRSPAGRSRTATPTGPPDHP
jgi:hypothetical protein